MKRRQQGTSVSCLHCWLDSLFFFFFWTQSLPRAAVFPLSVFAFIGIIAFPALPFFQLFSSHFTEDELVYVLPYSRFFLFQNWTSYQPRKAQIQENYRLLKQWRIFVKQNIFQHTIIPLQQQLKPASFSLVSFLSCVAMENTTVLVCSRS